MVQVPLTAIQVHSIAIEPMILKALDREFLQVEIQFETAEIKITASCPEFSDKDGGLDRPALQAFHFLFEKL